MCLKEALAIQVTLRKDSQRLVVRSSLLEHLVYTLIPLPDEEPLNPDMAMVFWRGVKATLKDIDRDTPGGYGPCQGPPPGMAMMDFEPAKTP